MKTCCGVIVSITLYTLLAGPPGVSCNNNTSACPPLHTPFYGVLVYNGSWLSNDQPEWQENATVTLQCDRGYELTSDAGQSVGRSLEITCEGNDTWSDVPEQYSCLRVNCGLPPSVSNGTVSLSSPNITDFGSTATYTCNQGYILSGADVVVCQWQGNWTPQPNCTAIVDCGDPPAISNGGRNWTAGSPAPIGTTVTYTCDSSYTTDEADTVVCKGDGSWTAPPSCDAIVDCGDPPAISNGGRNWTTGSPAPIGTTVTYTCDSNYTTDGADMVVCKGDGSWTAPPSCDAIVDCGDPPAISNGGRNWTTGSPAPIGTTVTYTCDSNYTTDGADMVVCKGDGSWTAPPSCDAIVDCGDPPAISNGGRNWTADSPAPIGTTVTYTCDSSYTMDGANMVVCKGDGSWTAPPSCDAKPLLSDTQIIIIEGAVGGGIIVFLLLILTCICCCVCRYRIRQRRYVEDEEALANTGAFTLSNPLVGVKDEDAAGNPLYLTPDELTEFEQQH